MFNIAQYHKFWQPWKFDSLRFKGWQSLDCAIIMSVSSDLFSPPTPQVLSNRQIPSAPWDGPSYRLRNMWSGNNRHESYHSKRTRIFEQIHHGLLKSTFGKLLKALPHGLWWLSRYLFTWSRYIKTWSTLLPIDSRSVFTIFCPTFWYFTNILMSMQSNS